jgi:predicted SnoaL-like aldol condensation-catalyzing enzyme
VSDLAVAARHKQAVLALHQDILAGAGTALLDRIVAADYQPHTPALKNVASLPRGRDALRERLKRRGAMANQVVRLIADGDRVWAHVHYGGTAPMAGVDVYRFDAESRIVEHWNLRQPLRGDLGHHAAHFESAHPEPFVHRLDPAWLRERVQSMLTRMWRHAAAELVAEYYDPCYIQHNPDMPGGYQRILEIVRHDIRLYVEKTGTPFPIEIHQIGAEGDLVFVHISIIMAGINRNDGDRSTNVDIFRVNPEGRMCEHWDVLQMQSESKPDDPTIF